MDFLLVLGLLLIFLGMCIYIIWFQKKRVEQLVNTEVGIAPQLTVTQEDVKTDTKSLLRDLIISVFIAPIFLYFMGVRLSVSNGITKEDMLIALGIGVLVGLAQVVRSSKEIWLKVRFLYKPLWGFRETSEGHKDISLDEHPYVATTLIVVILIVFAYLTYQQIKWSN